MGQKVHPTGFRLGVIKKHHASWYAKGKLFKENLIEDLKVRDFLKKKLRFSSVSSVDIERSAQNFIVNINTSRPGIIIGKKGEEIEEIKKAIEKIVNRSAQINIKEIRKPDLDAQLVAANIAVQLEKRAMFRRVIKRAAQNCMRQGALGVKVRVSGRLGGAEIARAEWHKEGRVPLHTLKADIDYGLAEAKTTYGIIGVKVWICKGEVQKKKNKITE